MNTNAISSGYSNPGTLQSATDAQRPKPQDRNGVQDGGKERVSRGGGVLAAVSQALGQVGVNIPPPPGKTAAIQTVSANQAAEKVSGGGDIQQALHSFVNDLFQAARGSDKPAAELPAKSAGSAAGGQPYGGLAGKVEGLARQVATGSGGDSVSQLKSSFDSLVKALGSNATAENSTASGSTPKLADFLQKLSQNLQGGNANPAGYLISTAA